MHMIVNLSALDVAIANVKILLLIKIITSSNINDTKQLTCIYEIYY
jgi:hypothetical protein